MKPHKIYGTIDEKTITQFSEALEHPSVLKGALMPDAHPGYTIPIGSVIATNNVVFPQWIGYDIGCGVSSVMTNLHRDEVERNAQEIFEGICEAVPLGFKHQEKEQFWVIPEMSEEGLKIFKEKDGLKQLGTLGGGNHFIELGHDEDGCVWATVHSGSRGVGHGIAEHYMKLDEDLEGYASGLSVDSIVGADYLMDMSACGAFAKTNRQKILSKIGNVLRDTLGTKQIIFLNSIDKMHNYAEVKYTDGIMRPTVIHRKGATHAGLGEWGVVPGNMRDGVFITEGLGNADSLFSCSHGAGRSMGRKVAERTLDSEEFKEGMAGITCSLSGHLDEAPRAYKDIFKVMEDQKDLCRIKYHIKTLINVKG